MSIKFNATAQEIDLITKVLERAKVTGIARRQMAMDLEATHCNGMPLCFQRLVDSNSVDFFHDIHGIAKAIDRTTGKLAQKFVPRCAVANHKRAA